MPKRLSGFSMSHYNGDLYIIGGTDFDSKLRWQNAIHKLQCGFCVCYWTTIKQELKFPRSDFTAIPVADSFCKPSDSYRFQANFFHILILIVAVLCTNFEFGFENGSYNQWPR